MARPAGAIGQFDTGVGPNINDPLALPQELIWPAYQQYMMLLQQRNALAREHERTGLVSWAESVDRASKIPRQWLRGEYEKPERVPIFSVGDKNISIDPSIIKDRERLELQIAALDAQLDDLLQQIPFLSTMRDAGGDMEQALYAQYERNVAAGVPKGQAATQYQAGLERLAKGQPAVQEDTKATQEIMDRITRGQVSLDPKLFDNSQTTQTTETITDKIDWTNPWDLQQMGVPAYVIAAASMGDPDALSSWIKGTQQAMDAQMGPSSLQQLQAEQLRRTMEQNEIEQNSLLGILGGLAPSGAISPQNIADYYQEPGVYGDITRAYYNQLTGNATPWQLQQWEADQAFRQQQWEAQQQQLGIDNAYRQQALAQQAAYQQAVLEQQRREMAAQVGQAVANMANQSYVNTLGFRLPAGTQYAPGFEPGGLMSQMAGMSGLPYSPWQIPVANPPTPDDLLNVVRRAIDNM